MKQLLGSFRKWADWFDLPSEVAGTATRIEMVGKQRLQIQNHQGVEHFSPQKLQLRTEQGSLLILGDSLKIKAIFPDTVFVEGTIQEVKYVT